MNLGVELVRFDDHDLVANSDLRIECHVGEFTRSVVVFNHGAFGLVDVMGHDDPGRRTEVEVPEHVALADTCHEKFLGVIAARVPAKRRV